MHLLSRNHAQLTLNALDRSLAVIEFTPDGQVVTANANFLGLMGYELADIVGQPHAVFVTAEERASEAYRSFWQELRAGAFKSAEFQRVAKDGRAVFLQATYNPIMVGGKVIKVVKVAADVTQQKTQQAECEGIIRAASTTQAIIQFTPDGHVLEANQNFLDAMGYTLEEIRGRHHSLFVPPQERETPAYRTFWAELGRGTFQTGEFRRIAKNGQDVWIQGSYNPVFDAAGQQTKVVKFAVDTTAQVNQRRRREETQSSISADIERIAQEISDTSHQAATASAATDQTSAGINAVASGAEELSASVAEISRQLGLALGISRDAVTESERTNEVVSALAEAAQRIGQVIDLIKQIASQTNLLALNATIEAARAGEAGRGFSVVATEVKSLAGQTAHATDEIATQIAAVQERTQEAVAALATIGSRIRDINEISTGIATAVDEQSSVAKDMSHSMQDAAHGVASITRSMAAIAASTRHVEHATQELRTVSREIA